MAKKVGTVAKFYLFLAETPKCTYLQLGACPTSCTHLFSSGDPSDLEIGDDLRIAVADYCQKTQV